MDTFFAHGGGVGEELRGEERAVEGCGGGRGDARCCAGARRGK